MSTQNLDGLGPAAQGQDVCPICKRHPSKGSVILIDKAGNPVGCEHGKQGMNTPIPPPPNPRLR